jgi:hypothetical protein
MANSGVPNSTTVASCSFAGPGRTGNTRTGMRTGESFGKNRDNCSAHPRSSKVSVICPFVPPPLTLKCPTLALSRADTHPTRSGTQYPVVEIARGAPKGKRIRRFGKSKKGQGLEISLGLNLERLSHAETLLSQLLVKHRARRLRRVSAIRPGPSILFPAPGSHRASECCISSASYIASRD